MDKYRLLLWMLFENSGSVSDYLKYKIVDKMDFEAGESFGSGEDPRHSAEDNKIW